MSIEKECRQFQDKQKVDEDGYMDVEPKHLLKLINLIQSKSDVDTVIKEFYNMKQGWDFFHI